MGQAKMAFKLGLSTETHMQAEDLFTKVADLG